MFTNFTIKPEIVDKSYQQISEEVFNYESFLKTVDETKTPPKKKIKIETEIRDPRLLKHRSNDAKIEPKVEVKQEVDHKFHRNVDHECKLDFGGKNKTKSKKKMISSSKPQVNNKSFFYSESLAPTTALYDNVLQEIFQWSPEWLQGIVTDKPPLLKFEQQIKQNGFKYDYSRKEYISRHLPFVLRGLFIKLSDTFKNEAPSRSAHLIFINDCQNNGHSKLNRLLICYSVRNIRQTPKPIAKINDIITVSLSVITGEVETTKKYFGIISSHSMLEINDLDEKVIKCYESLTNTELDEDICDYLLWEKLTILTKRAQNSQITPKRLARMDVLMNAGFDLRLMQNLLDESLKCTKLMTNIFSANGNIHQFSTEELEDFRTVRRTLSHNAVEMINKTNPMVFYKGINNLMIVDISDSTFRFKYMCDIAVEAILSNIVGKLRILVITSSETINNNWLKRLTLIGGRTSLKPWYVDSTRGWTRHVEVSRFVSMNAKRIYESLGSKLKQMLESEGKTYRELVRRKQIYQEIKESHKSIPSPFLYSNSHKSSSFVIAREELLNKGLENALNESNVIIGTFYDVLNCRQLFNDKSRPFDCCIIDDSHLLSDAYILSIVHLGIKTMIIGGDSDKRTDLSEDPVAMENKFNVSLFERIIKKCLNFT